MLNSVPSLKTNSLPLIHRLLGGKYKLTVWPFFPTLELLSLHSQCHGVSDAEVTRELHTASAHLMRPSQGGLPRASTRTHSLVSSLLCSPTPSPMSFSIPLPPSSKCQCTRGFLEPFLFLPMPCPGVRIQASVCRALPWRPPLLCLWHLNQKSFLNMEQVFPIVTFYPKKVLFVQILSMP